MITLIVSVVLTALALILCFVFYPFGLALIPSVVGGAGTLGVLTTGILLGKKVKAEADALLQYNKAVNDYKDNLGRMHSELSVKLDLDLIDLRR